MSSSNTPVINFSFSDLVENPKGLNPPGQDEIAVLKSQVESLQNELKKMKIDLLQKDEIIDDLRKGREKYVSVNSYEQVARKPVSNVHCLYYDEDIEVDHPEEKPYFVRFPCLDKKMKVDEERHEKIKQQNAKARQRGISERHAQPERSVSLESSDDEY
jgi:hypothetical protein